MQLTTERFSDKVQDYIQYRPSYPVKMIEYLCNELNLNNTSYVADIGSGTGILTKLLVDKCKMIFGVEPNTNMREASVRHLSKYDNFIPVNGTSENTTLNDNSIDFITVAQAFHWFNIEATMLEFQRIIKKNGLMILIWNNRINNTDFLKVYEQLLRQYATDYNEVNHKNISEDTIKRLYKKNYNKLTFENYQEFDFSGVIGRLSSCSYSPKKNTKEYQIIYDELENAFNRYSVDNKIKFNYETEMYIGEI